MMVSNPLFYLIYIVIEVYTYLLVAYVIISWLIAFEVINRHSQFVQQISYALHRLFEPVLKRIRPHMPDLGGIDLSVLVLFIGVQVVAYTVRWVEYNLAQM